MSHSRILKTAHGIEHPLKMSATQIEGASNKVEFEYHYKGDKCKVKEVSSQKGKAIAAYGLIKKDLKFVEKTISHSINLSHLLKEDTTKFDSGSHQYFVRKEVDFNADMIKSFYISSIVTYGKCFVQAQGRRIKLEPSEVFKDNENLKKVHLDVMEQRHQYIAHAGNTNHEHSRYVLIFTPDGQILSNAETAHIVGYGEEFFEQFLELTQYVHSYVNNVFEKKCQHFFDSEINDKPFDDLIIGAV